MRGYSKKAKLNLFLANILAVLYFRVLRVSLRARVPRHPQSKKKLEQKNGKKLTTDSDKKKSFDESATRKFDIMI